MGDVQDRSPVRAVASCSVRRTPQHRAAVRRSCPDGRAVTDTNRSPHPHLRVFARRAVGKCGLACGSEAWWNGAAPPLRERRRTDRQSEGGKEGWWDGGTPHRPPKRVGQCSGPCFRSHAGAAEGAAGGGRGERMRQRMGRQGAERGHAVGPRQSGNLSKRRGNFESIVNHGFESRCCGCAGAVSVRSLRPWQMLTPLASPPQVFTAQRACTRPTVARGAGTNAKNIRRCKGGPGQPPCGRAPRARHLLIRWRWGELGRDVTGQTRGVAAALAGCPSGPTAAAHPDAAVATHPADPSGATEGRAFGATESRRVAVSTHAVSTPSIQNGRGACFRTACWGSRLRRGTGEGYGGSGQDKGIGEGEGGGGAQAHWRPGLFLRLAYAAAGQAGAG